MMKKYIPYLAFSLTLLHTLSGDLCREMALGQLSILDMSPSRNSLNAGLLEPITMSFDRPVNPNTFTSNSVSVYGKWSGVLDFDFEFSNNNQDVTFKPTGSNSFSAGEQVTVMLSNSVAAADTTPLQPGGYSYQYWTRSRATGPAASYTQIATMSTGVDTRPYAAVAADLNNDGWLDLTVMNEDKSDLRVFTNKADGTGALNSYTTQSPSSYSVGRRVSPVETHDFNRDGNTDIAVANINDNNVSILLGNGNGTYAPQQKRNVGTQPRGIAILDVDGDGDMDLVTANYSSNNMSLMLNNGAGVFGAATFFEGGVDGERSLQAGDMNNDGILDLVVGGFNNSTYRIHLGNGTGGFTMMPTASSAGGKTWEIALGDLNGDGNLDVASANGYSESGSIAFGNGAGQLASATVYPTLALAGSTPTGNEIGDVDGDGDLDWIISPYGNGGGASRWRLFLNDGNGAYSPAAEFASNGGPAWAVLADLDNDGDLDFSLIDEEADHFKVFRTNNLKGDMNLNGVVDESDIAGFVEALRNPASYEGLFGPHSTLQGDFSGNGVLDFDDVPGFLALLPAGVQLFNPVPEPTTLLLLSFAGILFVSARRDH